MAHIIMKICWYHVCSSIKPPQAWFELHGTWIEQQILDQGVAAAVFHHSLSSSTMTVRPSDLARTNYGSTLRLCISFAMTSIKLKIQVHPGSCMRTHTVSKARSCLVSIRTPKYAMHNLLRTCTYFWCLMYTLEVSCTWDNGKKTLEIWWVDTK